MNRERAKELLPLIEAYANGRDIQYQPVDGGRWLDVWPGWDGEGQYRIKPEPHDIKWLLSR